MRNSIATHELCDKVLIRGAIHQNSEVRIEAYTAEIITGSGFVIGGIRYTAELQTLKLGSFIVFKRDGAGMEFENNIYSAWPEVWKNHERVVVIKYDAEGERRIGASTTLFRDHLVRAHTLHAVAMDNVSRPTSARHFNLVQDAFARRLGGFLAEQQTERRRAVTALLEE